MNTHKTEEEKAIQKLLVKSINRLNFNPDETIDILNEVISRSKKEGLKQYEIISLSRLAIIFAQKGDIKSCFDYCRSAILLGRQVQDKIHLAKVYTNIAIIFSMWDHYDKGDVYIQNAIDLKDESFDAVFLMLLIGNKGMNALNQGRTEEAMEAFIYEKEIGESASLNLIVSHFHFGMCHLKMKNYSLAIHYFKLMDNNVSQKNAIHLLTRDVFLGSLFNERHEYGKARVILERALVTQEKKLTNSQQKLNILNFLSVTYAGLGLYKKAYETQMKYLEEEKALKRGKMLLSYEEKNKASEMRELHSKLNSLETVNAELELFASKAAHDIKEPLRTITNFTGLLSRELKGKLTIKAQDYLVSINSNTKRLSNMLTDMLNFAVIGQPKTIKQLDLRTIIDNIEISLEALINESQAQIVLKNDLTFESDQTLITLLFQNLITNSIKYCAKTPIVSVSVKQKDSELLFEVQDNGIGIEEAYQDKIFNPLERLHNQLEFDGTGLGLASCKRIVNELNGRIGVISQLNMGSTFWFALPVNPK